MITLSNFDGKSFEFRLDFTNFEEMKTRVLWNVDVDAETKTSDKLREEREGARGQCQRVRTRQDCPRRRRLPAFLLLSQMEY